MSLEPAGGGGRRRAAAATAPPGALARLRRPPEGLWRGSGSGCRQGSPAPMSPAAAVGLPLRRALPEPPPPSSPCSTEGLRAAWCGEGLGAAAPRGDGDGDTGGGAADPSPLGAAARQLPTPLQQRRREVGGGGESWTASPGKC